MPMASIYFLIRVKDMIHSTRTIYSVEPTNEKWSEEYFLGGAQQGASQDIMV